MKKKKLSHNHLAEGETTGHFHAIDAVVYEREDQVRCFAGPATVTHHEHKPIRLPEGMMASGRIREMDHFAEEARQVRD